MKSILVIIVLALALAGCKKETPVATPVQKVISSSTTGATVITGPVIIRSSAPVKK